jgi:hypothetical protein
MPLSSPVFIYIPFYCVFAFWAFLGEGEFNKTTKSRTPHPALRTSVVFAFDI